MPIKLSDVPTIDEGVWLIWSEEHGAWWGPAERGYTTSISKAGRYAKARADQIVASANYGGHLNEIALPAPDLARFSAGPRR